MPTVRLARLVPVEALLRAGQGLCVGGPDLQDEAPATTTDTPEAGAGDAAVGARRDPIDARRD